MCVELRVRVRTLVLVQNVINGTKNYSLTLHFAFPNIRSRLYDYLITLNELLNEITRPKNNWTLLDKHDSLVKMLQMFSLVWQELNSQTQ